MHFPRLVSVLRAATLILPVFGLLTALELGCGITDSSDVGSNSGATSNKYAYGGGGYGGYDDGYADYGYGYGDYGGYGDDDYGGYGDYGHGYP